MTQMFRMMLLSLALSVAVLPVAAEDAPPDPNCPGAPAPRLIVHASARVLPGDANNVREQPARGAALVGTIPGGAEFTVLEGPVCAEGLNWWRVSAEELTGWTVEGSGAEYWVEPLEQAAAPIPEASTWVNPYRDPQIRISNPIIAGAVARVQTMSGDPLPLYANPTDATPSGEVAVNTLVTLVEEGAGGWWKVESEDGISGWVREGVEHTGRISPVRPTLAPVCPYIEDRVLFLTYDSALGMDIYTVRRDGARICNLSYGLQQNFETYDWSPDGQWIVFSAILEGSERCGAECNGELYVIRVDGAELRRLTFGQRSGRMQWSPDGQWIAVQMDGTEDRARDIRLIAPDGSAKRTLYTTRAGFGLMRWSPDGKYLAVNEDETMISGPSKFLRLIDVETGDSRIIFESTHNSTSLNWSPDSRYLVLATYVGTGRRVLIEVDVASGAFDELLEYVETYSAAYSPDGARIAFWRADRGAPRWVEVLDRATGEVTRLAALPGVNGRGLSWVPEGDALLVYSSGVMRVDASTGALRSVFVGSDGSNWYPPLVQPTTVIATVSEPNPAFDAVVGR